MAQERPRFAIERLRWVADPNALLDLESGQVAEHLALSVGVGVGYALNPLVVTTTENGIDVNNAALVHHRVGASVVGAIGLGGWLQLGFELPAVLYQDRDLEGTGLIGAPDLRRGGLGDLRTTVKGQLLRSNDHGVDLSLQVGVGAPTRSLAGAYLGDRKVTVLPELAIERRWGNLRVLANVGYFARPKTRSLGLRVDDEVVGRVGVGYRVAKLWEVSAATTGASSVFNLKANRTPLEVRTGVRWFADDAWVAHAGVGAGIGQGFGAPDVRGFVGLLWTGRYRDRDGDGIRDVNDRCPEGAEDADQFADDDGCPDPDNDQDGISDTLDQAPNHPEDLDGFQDEDGVPDPDNDGDGIADTNDQCPGEPEDRDGDLDEDGCPDIDQDEDGVPDDQDACPADAEDIDTFEDQDGCPDYDNDLDGIVDAADECPNDSETINGVDDKDGCPDEGASKVRLLGNKVEITEKVFFKTGRGIIADQSFDLLTQVAGLLKANRQITRLRIEGHTDSVGPDAKNLQLSQKRADAVRTFLVNAGVASDRLVSVGFGELRPVTPNLTQRGRETNRRVEFVIEEIDGVPVQPVDTPPSTPSETRSPAP